MTSAFGVTNFNSALLNENQNEYTQYGVLALQKSRTASTGNCPISPVTVDCITRRIRSAILINGVASDVVRQSYTNGIQADGSYQAQSGAHYPRRVCRQR